MKKNYFMHPLVNGVRFTICGIYDVESTTMKFGVARCSKKDQFSKKKGRLISEGRATKSPIFILKTPPETKLGEMFVKQTLGLLQSDDLKNLNNELQA